MTWLFGLTPLFLLIILYFSISFLIDHEGMSALDDKMTHLKQNMTLYRRQHDKKRVMMRCKCSYKYLNFKEARTTLLTYLAVFVFVVSVFSC